nr:ribonuclease H-like domain, reverse transcriptase, RNA-dependent DNA polymerase [Tanacetum cinerariifolium]
MFDFDVILGMDWLASHRATIDCYARTMIFGNVCQPEFVYHGSSPLKSVNLISAMKARTLISHGCQGFLASVMDTSLESPSIENLSVVREFADVFPDELLGLSPAREIEFGIELIPGAEPISKAPYRMAPVELKELKEQSQVTPKTSHLHVVKRIFRYLKGQPKLGLWYPRDSPFDFEAFFDSNYAGAILDRKSTIGGCRFLGKRLISWQCKKQTIVPNSTTEAEYVAAASCCGQVLWIQNEMLDYGFNLMNTKIYIDNENLTFWLLAFDYLISKGVFDMVWRWTKLDDAEGTACLSTAAIFEELARMGVLALEQTKTNQAANIKKLKKKVQKLKGKKNKRTHGLKRLYKIGLSARIVSSNEEDQGRTNDQDLFGVHNLDGDEVFVVVTIVKNVEQDATVAEKEVTTIEDIEVTAAAAATTLQISKDELTLAQTLMEIKAAKPKANGVTTQDPKPDKPLKKKDQIALDEEVARKLEAEMKAEMDEEETIAREKNEANIAMIEE